MISALVATVPRPPVSPRVLAMALSPDSMQAAGFSIADKRALSVKWDGGFVFPSMTANTRPFNTSPSFTCGSLCAPLSPPKSLIPLFSSPLSSQPLSKLPYTAPPASPSYTALQPRSFTTFPLAVKVSCPTVTVRLVCSYSQGGYKTAKNRRTTRSQIRRSSTVMWSSCTNCSVGMMA